MADIQTSQAQSMVAGEGSPLLEASQVQMLAAGIYPSEFVEASQVQLMAGTDAVVDVQASQLIILVAARGRVSDPRVLAWTYTQDGHDYYVLRLGMDETLVYDTNTDQWYNWGSGESSLWRPYDGTNWLGGTALGGIWSNVVVGDDGNGSLYFLNPGGDLDDHPLDGGDAYPFRRMITGQVVSPRGYSAYPCYGVELLGSIGQTGDPALTAVGLEVSDDRGQSYVSCGTVDVPVDAFDARVNWRSLGSIRAPGRLFRVTDYGALKRVDSLEMTDGS